MVDIKVEHILMFVIVAFLLYHLVGRCGMRSRDGFSVGGGEGVPNRANCGFIPNKDECSAWDVRCAWDKTYEVLGEPYNCRPICNFKEVDDCTTISDSYKCGESYELSPKYTDPKHKSNCGWIKDEDNEGCFGDGSFIQCIDQNEYMKINKDDLPVCAYNSWAPKKFYESCSGCPIVKDKQTVKTQHDPPHDDLYRCI